MPCIWPCWNSNLVILVSLSFFNFIQKRRDAAVAVADKAIEDYELFRKRCEEEDVATPVAGNVADDAMDVGGENDSC